MARYYESKSLIDFVKNNTPHINGETTMQCVVRAIQNAPAADVVPESEVERLKSICNSYALQYGTVRDQQKVIDEAKREVAREIFEEISKASVDWGCYCVTLSKGAFLAEDVNRTLTELKKKYTEEATDGKADH